MAQSRQLFACALLALCAALPTRAQINNQVDPGELAGMKARSIGPAAMSGRVADVAVVESDTDIVYVGHGFGRRLEVHQRRPHLGADLRRPAGGLDRRASPSSSPTRTSSGSAPARAIRATACRSAAASTGRSTAAGPGSTSGWRRPSASTASSSTRPIRTSPGSPPSAGSGGRTPSAASSRPRTAARPGARCSTSTSAPARPSWSSIPQTPNKLFAAMWDHRRQPWTFRSGGPGSGLYVTYDGGESWKRSPRTTACPRGTSAASASPSRAATRRSSTPWSRPGRARSSAPTTAAAPGRP